MREGRKENPERTEITSDHFYFLCQPADDIGALFERMLFLLLPWHSATSWEDMLALANSILRRNAWMRDQTFWMRKQK